MTASRSISEAKAVRSSAGSACRRAAGDRICVFLTHDNHGGARVVVEQLCDGLKRRGAVVDLGFLYGTGDAPAGSRAVDGGLRRFAGAAPIAFLDLWRRFRRDRPAAVIANLPIANAFVLGAAWLAGVPRRIAVHHVDTASYRPWSRRLDRIAGTLGAYTRVVAVSRPVLDSLADFPPAYRRRLCSIDNGMPRTAPSADRAALRRRFGHGDEDLVVVNVGRLSSQKNQAVLIDALAQADPAVRLVLVGDGELRPDLEQRARDRRVAGRVTFTGRVDPQTVADHLAAADLFALPSLYEGLSLALIEALHAGLPMLVSDVPSNRAPFEHAGPDACVAVPTEDAAAWAAAIAGLARDPARRRRLADAAARLSEHYDVERMIDDYLAEATA